MIGRGAAITFLLWNATVRSCAFLDNNVTIPSLQSQNAYIAGGAIYASASALTVTGSTFRRNSLWSPTQSFGGAIYTAYYRLTMRNCTLTGNVALVNGTSGNAAKGGAIYFGGTLGGLTVSGTTIEGNAATVAQTQYAGTATACMSDCRVRVWVSGMGLGLGLEVSV